MKRKQPPDINKEYLDAFREALLEFRNMDPSHFSGAEVVMDDLASVLCDLCLGGVDKAFPGRTPSLSEVLENLKRANGLSQEAVNAAYTLKAHLEDSYLEDADYDLMEDISYTVNELADLIHEFITKYTSEL